MAPETTALSAELLTRADIYFTRSQLFLQGKNLESLRNTICQTGKLRIKNRFVMPPLVTNFGDEEGYVTEESMAYYEKRAKGGFGLIITEATAICPGGKGFPYQFSYQLR